MLAGNPTRQRGTDLARQSLAHASGSPQEPGILKYRPNHQAMLPTFLALATMAAWINDRNYDICQ